ncbi:MAG: TetR/AcrR family transcriptional regulator [Ilumatobacteraceae bacterium]
MTDRRPYHHGNLAAAAVQAAEAEIARSGIADTSMRRVAERAGVSHTAIGRTFGDKAGLLAAVAAEGYRRLGDALESAGPTMLELGRAYLRFAERRPALFAVMFQPTIYPADDPAVVAARTRTTALLRSGVGQPVDAEPTAAAAVGAWAFVHGLAALWLGGALEGDLIEVYERAARATYPQGPPAVGAVTSGSA